MVCLGCTGINEYVFVMAGIPSDVDIFLARKEGILL
jgi:hypothetical protein